MPTSEAGTICGATKEMNEVWTCDKPAGHATLPHEDSARKSWWLPGSHGTYEPHHIAIEVRDRPKMSWYGMAYRYVCSCGKIGDSWEGNPQRAQKSCAQHSIAKGVVIDATGKSDTEKT